MCGGWEGWGGVKPPSANTHHTHGHTHAHTDTHTHTNTHLGWLSIVACVGVDEVFGSPVVHIHGVLVIAGDHHQAFAITRKSHGHDVPDKHQIRGKVLADLNCLQ